MRCVVAAGCWLAAPMLPAAQDVALPLKPDSVRFGVIGDFGNGSTAQYEVGKQMAAFQQKSQFTFVIMLGDNLYGGQRPQDFVRKFEAPYKALLDAKVDFFASLGNHDNPNQRFYEPFNMGGNRYHTFKKGNVRFFVLDSNYMDPVQLGVAREGAEERRARTGRSPTSIIRSTHRASTARRPTCATVLEPLFVKYGVNVVFAGHEHFYQRIKPQKGITYFVSGAGGQLRRGDIRRSDLTAVGFDTDRSFMIVEIADKEMTFQAISRTGMTVDRGTILQSDGPQVGN